LLIGTNFEKVSDVFSGEISAPSKVIENTSARSSSVGIGCLRV